MELDFSFCFSYAYWDFHTHVWKGTGRESSSNVQAQSRADTKYRVDLLGCKVACRCEADVDIP